MNVLPSVNWTGPDQLVFAGDEAPKAVAAGTQDPKKGRIVELSADCVVRTRMVQAAPASAVPRQPAEGDDRQ